MINNGNSEILNNLITNSNDAGIKPIKQTDGSSTLFQRDIDPPVTEKLDDEFDEDSGLSNDLNQSESPGDEEDCGSSYNDYGSSYNDYYSNYTDYTETSDLESSDSPKKETPSKNQKSGKKSPAKQKKNEEENKSPENYLRISKTNSRNLQQKSISSKPTPKPNSVSSTPHTNKVPKIEKYSRNLNSNFLEVLGYFLLISAIFSYIILINIEKEDESLLRNKYEFDAVTRLNDCVTPMNISVNMYPPSFIEYIKNGSSKYLKYDDSTQFIVVKKPYKSLFCKAVSFGDRHPDLCGLFILWIIAFIYYIHFRISRLRAERIVPDVMNLLSLNNNMCYLDDAKKKMKEKGHCLFGAWWQVRSIMEKENVKTVKMVDTKPFWSFNGQ